MDILIGRTIELLAIAIVVAIVARRLKLPYTVGLVLTGLALALMRFDAGFILTREVIFDAILPPLLFEAALNIGWSELRRDLVPVVAISTFGVLLCGAVVAGGLVFALGWPVGSALAFGALIGATDPIAVIALLKDTGVKGRLALLIESESLANDGVAALVFTIVLTALAPGAAPLTAASVGRELLLIVGGGVAIGVIVGLAGLLSARRTDDHLVETALTTVVAWGSFLIADRVGASGVLACVAAGLVMGNIGVNRESHSPLTDEGRRFVGAFWEFAAFLANSFVFLMIGLALARSPVRSWETFAIVVVLSLAGRAAAVYPLALAFAPTRWKIPIAQQHFLWWAGLRGALALALALSLPDTFPYRQEILVAAFGVVAFSVLVQGMTAGRALKWLKLDADACEISSEAGSPR